MDPMTPDEARIFLKKLDWLHGAMNTLGMTSAAETVYKAWLLLHRANEQGLIPMLSARR